MTELILDALHGSNEELAYELLLKHWDQIDGGSINDSNWNLLHSVCTGSYDVKFVSLLLKHPKIDPNALTNSGWTPVVLAIDRIDVLKVLLSDNRVDIYAGLPRVNMVSMICVEDNVTTMKLLIVYRNNLGNEIWPRISKDGCPLIYRLFHKYIKNPTKTRFECELELCPERPIADLFVLIVFLSDDFLTINTGRSKKTKRFFKIAKRLPMELQMILCHKTFGSLAININSKDFELAYRRLISEIG